MSVLKGNCVVDFIFRKEGRFSIKSTDGVWFGCNKNDPQCGKGDEIEFDYEVSNVRGKDYNNVVADSVLIIGNTAPAAQPAATTGNSTASPTYVPQRKNAVYDVASYWKAKFDHDIFQTQPEIRNQAARKAAIATVLGALAAGELEQPAAKKKGAKLEAIVNFVNELTLEYSNECVEYVESLEGDA